MPPHFRQPLALLGCDKKLLRWPGPFGFGFLSPQPPGIVGIGPIAGKSVLSRANVSWSFLFVSTTLFSRPCLFATSFSAALRRGKRASRERFEALSRERRRQSWCNSRLAMRGTNSARPNSVQGGVGRAQHRARLVAAAILKIEDRKSVV